MCAGPPTGCLPAALQASMLRRLFLKPLSAVARCAAPVEAAGADEGGLGADDGFDPGQGVRHDPCSSLSPMLLPQPSVGSEGQLCARAPSQQR